MGMFFFKVSLVPTAINTRANVLYKINWRLVLLAYFLFVYFCQLFISFASSFSVPSLSLSLSPFRSLLFSRSGITSRCYLMIFVFGSDLCVVVTSRQHALVHGHLILVMELNLLASLSIFISFREFKETSQLNCKYKMNSLI